MQRWDGLLRGDVALAFRRRLKPRSCLFATVKLAGVIECGGFVLRTNVIPHLKGEMWGTRLTSQ